MLQNQQQQAPRQRGPDFIGHPLIRPTPPQRNPTAPTVFHVKQTPTPSLTTLPGLGPRSVQLLQQAGIHSLDDLRQLGSVAAYVRVKRSQSAASLNLLWALEAALTGQHWQAVAREHRTSLLLALEAVAPELLP